MQNGFLLNSLTIESFVDLDEESPAPSVSEHNEEEKIKPHRSSITSPARGERPLTFIPPMQSVQKHEWVKDETVSSCMQCRNEFSMVSVAKKFIFSIKITPFNHWSLRKINI